MWASAQPDGRPAEYRWRPVLNAAVWLAATARVPCSNAANRRAQDLETQSEFCTWQNSATEQQPPKMYLQSTSPVKGQTLCKIWLASVERRRCSNEAKTRKPLKFAGVPQTNETILAASRPSGDFWGRHCCLTSFSDCRYVP